MFHFRILLLAKDVQTCGISLIYLILWTMESFKTGMTCVMCGIMHFTTN